MPLPDNFVGAVHHCDNLELLAKLPDASVDLIYIDPPFNTGKVQKRRNLRTQRVTGDEPGDRTGFGGRRYRTEALSTTAYDDRHDDYLAFLEPRIAEAHRVLADHGSLYFHIDYREVHYCKLLIDTIFGRDNFLNEIIWAYDYGGRPKNRWPAKHDTILFYAKRAGAHVFNRDEIDREPYMAPGLVGPEKAARGKLPTDTWWHTIVSPTGKEKLGYPTQKPLGVLRRIVRASAPPGGLVLDFFAGSGSAGAAALDCGRRFLLADNNPEAIATMGRRFADRDDVAFFTDAPTPT
ncbi:MAG: site-specific DNA-methyltransferase [Myxococcales bacterium]|nr:site-specific DNA-methyltransferase [Myxococcales bacterium]